MMEEWESGAWLDAAVGRLIDDEFGGAVTNIEEVILITARARS